MPAVVLVVEGDTNQFFTARRYA